MHSVQMCIHAILILELLQTKLAWIHKWIGEVLALNMFDDIVHEGTGFEAYGTLVQLGLGVVLAVLSEQSAGISWI